MPSKVDSANRGRQKPTAAELVLLCLNKCLPPVYRRERRFFDICIPNVRLRNNGSNVDPISLLQILVVQGEGEREKSNRKDRK